MKHLTYLNLLSWLLITIGTIGSIFHPSTFSTITYGAGALCAVGYSISISLAHKTDDVRTRRLYGLQFLTSLLPAVGTYLLISHMDLWVVLTLIFAAVSLFLSYRLK